MKAVLLILCGLLRIEAFKFFDKLVKEFSECHIDVIEGARKVPWNLYVLYKITFQIRKAFVIDRFISSVVLL